MCLASGHPRRAGCGGGKVFLSEVLDNPISVRPSIPPKCLFQWIICAPYPDCTFPSQVTEERKRPLHTLNSLTTFWMGWGTYNYLRALQAFLQFVNSDEISWFVVGVWPRLRCVQVRQGRARMCRLLWPHWRRQVIKISGNTQLLEM